MRGTKSQDSVHRPQLLKTKESFIKDYLSSLSSFTRRPCQRDWISAGADWPRNPSWRTICWAITHCQRLASSPQVLPLPVSLNHQALSLSLFLPACLPAPLSLFLPACPPPPPLSVKLSDLGHSQSFYFYILNLRWRSERRSSDTCYSILSGNSGFTVGKQDVFSSEGSPSRDAYQSGIVVPQTADRETDRQRQTRGGGGEAGRQTETETERQRQRETKRERQSERDKRQKASWLDTELHAHTQQASSSQRLLRSLVWESSSAQSPLVEPKPKPKDTFRQYCHQKSICLDPALCGRNASEDEDPMRLLKASIVLVTSRKVTTSRLCPAMFSNAVSTLWNRFNRRSQTER